MAQFLEQRGWPTLAAAPAWELMEGLKSSSGLNSHDTALIAAEIYVRNHAWLIAHCRAGNLKTRVRDPEDFVSEKRT